jgi:hypothetical protein
MAPSHPFGGSLVVNPSGDADLVLLNPAGRLLWEAYAGGLDEEGLAGRLAERLEVALEPARGFVRQALEAWRRAGLVDRPEAPAAAAAVATAPTLAQLDALPGPELARTYDLCGASIELTFAPADLEQVFAPRYGSAATDAAPAYRLRVCAHGGGYALVEGGAVVLWAPTEDALFGDVTRRIAELSYGTTEWLAVLHAGAVRSPEGRTFVLPGTNGRGKSTLVTGLMAAGFDYLSDDCVPVTRNGAIVPLPFAICLKEGSWNVVADLAGFAAAPVHLNHNDLPCRYLAPTRTARGLARVDAFVFPSYVEGARLELRRLIPEEVLEGVLASRAWLSRSDADLAVLLELMQSRPGFALTYGSTEHALGALAEIGASSELLLTKVPGELTRGKISRI